MRAGVIPDFMFFFFISLFYFTSLYCVSVTEIVQEHESTPEPLDEEEGLPKQDEEKTGETEEVVVPGKELDRTSTKSSVPASFPIIFFQEWRGAKLVRCAGVVPDPNPYRSEVV